MLSDDSGTIQLVMSVFPIKLTLAGTIVEFSEGPFQNLAFSVKTLVSAVADRENV